MSAAGTTRRALLGGMGAASFADISIAAPVPAGGSGDIASAIARHRRASAICEAYARHVHRPARVRFEALKAAIPHRSTTNTYASSTSTIRPSTGDNSMVAVARSICADFDNGKIKSVLHDDYEAMLRELLALVYEREEAIERARVSSGVAHAADRLDTLCDAALDAQEAVIETPVHSVVELTRKVEHLEDEDDWIRARESIIADVRRLGGAA